MAEENISGFNSVKSAAAGGAVSGAFGIVSGGLNYAYQKRLAKQQQAYNQQNAAQAQLYALEQQRNSANLQYENFQKQFGDENARQDYLLTHQKQMEVQALRNAGLNPALAGGAVANVTTANPSASAPTGSGPMAQAGLGHVDTPDLGADVAAGASAFKLVKEQSSLLKAQALDKLEDVANKQAWRDPTTQKLIQEAATSKAQELLADSQRERIEKLTPLEADKVIAEKDYFSAQAKAIAEKLPEELKVLVATAAELDARSEMESAHASLYREQINTEKTQQSYNKAAAYNQNKQGDYYVRKAAEADENIGLLKKQGVLTDKEAEQVVQNIAKLGAEARRANSETELNQIKQSYERYKLKQLQDTPPAFRNRYELALRGIAAISGLAQIFM